MRLLAILLLLYSQLNVSSSSQSSKSNSPSRLTSTTLPLQHTDFNALPPGLSTMIALQSRQPRISENFRQPRKKISKPIPVRGDFRLFLQRRASRNPSHSSQSPGTSSSKSTPKPERMRARSIRGRPVSARPSFSSQSSGTLSSKSTPNPVRSIRDRPASTIPSLSSQSPEPSSSKSTPRRLIPKDKVCRFFSPKRRASEATRAASLDANIGRKHHLISPVRDLIADMCASPAPEPISPEFRYMIPEWARISMELNDLEPGDLWRHRTPLLFSGSDASSDSVVGESNQSVLVHQERGTLF